MRRHSSVFPFHLILMCIPAFLLYNYFEHSTYSHQSLNEEKVCHQNTVTVCNTLRLQSGSKGRFLQSGFLLVFPGQWNGSRGNLTSSCNFISLQERLYNSHSTFSIDGLCLNTGTVLLTMHTHTHTERQTHICFVTS